jgi:hypothetical protein
MAAESAIEVCLLVIEIIPLWRRQTHASPPPEMAMARDANHQTVD